MAISEADIYAAPVLLKENYFPAASIAGRRPVELDKADFFGLAAI